MKTIRFVRPFKIYFPGDVATFPAAEADAIIAAGSASEEEALMKEDEKQAVTPKPEKPAPAADRKAVAPKDEQRSRA